jgi:hypothetical protein
VTRLLRSLGLAVVGALLLTAGAGAASRTSPRQALLQALSRARAMTNVAAARELALATFPELWINGRDAVAPSYGTTVFNDSAAALRALERAGRSQAAITTITLIIRADRALAAGAIADAHGGPAQPLIAAKGALAAGDRAASHRDSATAVQSYTNAWLFAFRALDRLVVAEVTHMPASALATAADNALGSRVIALAGPRILHGQPPLRAGGKPELFYAGSEACPFCAVERWGMIVALSQFGTFSKVALIQSVTTDHPAVRTFTFFGSSYRSHYLTFVPVEVWSNVRHGFSFSHLQRLSPFERGLVHRFDPPLTTPFLDIAGSFVRVGSTVDPHLLGGLSWAQIGASLKDPSSLPAQAVGGTAEVLTAELCEVTGGKPASVCSSSVVSEYERALPLLNGHGGGCPPPGSASDESRARRGDPVATPAKCRV